MYTDYDRFAWIYNRHWGKHSLEFLPALDKLVLDSLPTGCRVLDLGCGTGQFAHALSERGFSVVGIDGSEELLAYARENAPGVEFVHADFRSFRLDEPVAATLCLYDSLNHIMSLGELEEVFGRVFAALAPGGVFVFDLNMELAYADRWSGSFGIAEDDHAGVIRLSYDAEERVAGFVATIFRREEGAWERSDVALSQRCYPEHEIRDALEAVGFRGIEGVDGASGQAGRIFFRARREG